MHRLLLIALAAVVPAVLSAPSFAVTITLNGLDSSSIGSLAGDSLGTVGLGSVTSVDASPVSLPTAGAPTAINGASSSTTNYTLSNAGFHFTVDHLRDPSYLHIATSGGAIFFSPDANVDYLISGFYGYDATDDQGIRLDVSLYDYTTGTAVFRNEQESIQTMGESFTVGEEGGDYNSYLGGPPTGTLVAGHDYELSFDYRIVTTNSNGDGHATGYLDLTFVPEPSTALLCGLGLVGLVTWRKRRA